MEKQTNPQFMYENLVTTKKYSELYNVAQKTVYEWINAGRLTMIDFLGKKWLDKTVAAKPPLKRPRNTYDLNKTTILTAKHL